VSPRTCQEVLSLLDAFVDGELDGERARAVRGHVGGCPPCAARLEATEILVDAARTLEPVDPPESLLGATFQRLAALEAADAEHTRLWWWWKAWRKTVLAGGLAAAAVGAFALSFAWRARPAEEPPPARAAVVPETDLYLEAVREVARADEEYGRAIDDLRAIVEDERPRWRPEVARAFDKNLADIDAAVERQRDLARRAPGDFAAQDALHAAYKKKIDFLQEAVVRGDAEAAP
jgi:hypothetical protein